MKRIAFSLIFLLLLPAFCLAEGDPTASVSVSDEAAPCVTDDDLTALLRACTDASGGDLREVRVLSVSAAEGWAPGAHAETAVEDCWLFSVARGERVDSASMKLSAIDMYGDSLPLDAIDRYCADHPVITGPDEASECNSREFRLRLYAAADSPASSFSRVMLYQLDSIVAPDESPESDPLPFPISVADEITPYVRASDLESLRKALADLDPSEIQSVAVVHIDRADLLPFDAANDIDDLFLLSVEKGGVPSQEDIQRIGISYPFPGPGEDSPCVSREYRSHLINGSSASDGGALMMLYQIDRVKNTP